MVTEVPRGKSFKEVRAEELGVDLAARVPASGLWGYRVMVVDILPNLSEMEENVLYCVRIPTP